MENINSILQPIRKEVPHRSIPGAVLYLLSISDIPNIPDYSAILQNSIKIIYSWAKKCRIELND